jgi:hypothetical protein
LTPGCSGMCAWRSLPGWASKVSLWTRRSGAWPPLEVAPGSGGALPRRRYAEARGPSACAKANEGFPRSGCAGPRPFLLVQAPLRFFCQVLAIRAGVLYVSM